LRHRLSMILSSAKISQGPQPNSSLSLHALQRFKTLKFYTTKALCFSGPFAGPAEHRLAHEAIASIIRQDGFRVSNVKADSKSNDLTCTTFYETSNSRYLKQPEAEAARQAAYAAEQARLEDEEVERARGEETQAS
jgi:hypothetical protein